jgi:hypothetical protein
MLPVIIQEMNRIRDIANEYLTSLNTTQISLMKYFALDAEDVQEDALF